MMRFEMIDVVLLYNIHIKCFSGAFIALSFLRPHCALCLLESLHTHIIFTSRVAIY